MSRRFFCGWAILLPVTLAFTACSDDDSGTNNNANQPDASETDSGTGEDGGGGQLEIVTVSLPSGIVNVEYAAVVEGAGGTGSGYSWSVASGTVPPGLTLTQGTPSATLSGVPTDPGTYNFEIQLTDSAMDTAQRAYEVEVVVAGNIIYVDQQIGTDSCTDYDPNGRACGGGTEEAYRTLAGAAATAVAGDMVLIREGTFGEQLIPQNSGTAGQYITWRNYGAETVTITGDTLSPAVDISDRSYLVIEGLTVTDVRRWLHALNAHYNIVRNCTFTRALDSGGSSKTGIFFQEATYNRILYNIIEDSTQDNLSLIVSDHNLVQGNDFRVAAHTLWTIKAGNFNVIRNNYFHNAIQKIGEIFDAWDAGFNHEFFIQDSTKHNLVEGNEFAYTPSSGDHSPYAGIQYAGQQGIIRRNVFHHTVGPALSMTNYGDEAEYTTDNRVYHNVFYGTDFAGISISPTTTYTHFGNIYKNNICARSVFVANDTRWSWYTGELDGQPVQILTGRLDGLEFENNCIFNLTPGETYVITYGWRNSSNNWAEQHNVTWWEQNYPGLFHGNIDSDPLFVDANNLDFTLQATSPLIDAGAFLTVTASAGSGTVMDVEDVSFFYDGYGIPGENGDEIQLDGQTSTATVVSIDYGNNTLTVDTSLTWTAGQGVALTYNGNAPDVGAYERP